MSFPKKRAAAVCISVLAPTLLLTACFDQPAIRPQEVKDMDAFGDAVTDKARYEPGERVKYALKLKEGIDEGQIIVRYKHLDRLVEEEKIDWKGESEVRWEWEPPADDFTGYMTEIFFKQGKEIVDQTNIAVDVSSDWGKFPRYGYLADFMAMEQADREAVIERLNRFHINGIQFYDWQWKHHMPLKLESGKPAETWPDIANRQVSYETVKRYIDLAHEKNMKAMNYNLLFGAYEDAENDGVKMEWGLFRDPLGKNQDRHPLPDSWASDILLMDPSNPEWQQYLIQSEMEVFKHLPFDGWHVDQLGDRGPLWNKDGDSVNLAQTYAPFLQEAKKKLDVDYVMNAVGQYGQAYIATQAPVKFLYTEVWGDHPHYRHLKEIIDQNAKYSKGKLNTVLAAYMNYDHANKPGEFNTPGVLLANAVIFASGGSHLELGENMLAKEYFPNRNLTIPEELEKRLVHYYDFLTAYQNLLRDGAQEIEAELSAASSIALSPTMEQGKVWVSVKRKDDKQIFHFVNFTDAVHMNWNDANATQAEPEQIEHVTIALKTDKKPKKVWMASPDYYGGSPIAIEFEHDGDTLEFALPKLKYWDMVVVDYAD